MSSNSSTMKYNSNVSNSKEKDSLNSAKIGLENMHYKRQNSHSTIYRVWIAKKAVDISDARILDLYEISEYNPSETVKRILKDNEISIPKIEKTIPNILNIYNGIVFGIKHWAIILELSNDTYVNIQFGRTGFSLEEFSDGERCLNAYLAISQTWGRKNSPLSFCFLGECNYKYRDLLKYLVRKKEKEKVEVGKKGRVWYNLLSENCQLFACEIEALIFGEIKLWHSFPYYL